MRRRWFICGDWLSDFNHLTDATVISFFCLMAPDLTLPPVDRGGIMVAFAENFL